MHLFKVKSVMHQAQDIVAGKVDVLMKLPAAEVYQCQVFVNTDCSSCAICVILLFIGIIEWINRDEWTNRDTL